MKEIASFSDLISTTLVYDQKTLTIPEQLLPDDGATAQEIRDSRRLIGTDQEQLCELSGRACYDSLSSKKGRLSWPTEDKEGYHQHILAVGHTSVYGHANMTFAVSGYDPQDHYQYAYYFQSIPGTVVIDEGDHLRVTTNLRAVADICYKEAVAQVTWNRPSGDMRDGLIGALYRMGLAMAPGVLGFGDWDVRHTPLSIMAVDPVYAEEKWVSCLWTGSRGMSHELVRHGYRTAISQRSTRYVDESGSPWVMHPLMIKHLREEVKTKPYDVQGIAPSVMEILMDGVYGLASKSYDKVVEILQPWLIDRGVDKFTARKQARGAARGLLGNALYTEVMFSCSIAQAHRIVAQRASVHADAEIRENAVQFVHMVKGSQYADEFDRYEIVESPDGIGFVVDEAE